MPTITRIKDYDVPHILQARDIIKKNPTRHFTAEDLARAVGTSDFKLKKGFKEVLHTTIHQFRLRLILSIAKNLLEETDLTINEIAYKMGFESRDGFSRAFKRLFHTTPKQCRDQREHRTTIIP